MADEINIGAENSAPVVNAENTGETVQQHESGEGQTANASEPTEAPKVEDSTEVKESSEGQAPKTYTKDELAKIANARSKDSFSKGLEEGYEKAKKEAAMYSQMATNETDPMRKAVREELARVHQEAVITTGATAFGQKLNEAATNDPKFIEIVKDLDLMQMRTDVAAEVFNSVDNVVDVLKDLGTRAPHEYANIIRTAEEGRLNLAKSMLRAASERIKTNAVALEKPVARQPLTPTQPSPIKGSSDGIPSVTDFTKESWLWS